MISLLAQEMLTHGNKSKIVPIDFLQIIENDILTLKNDPSLDEYTKFGISSDFFNFEATGLDFDAKSIIVVASPSPFAKIIFSYKGKNVPLILSPGFDLAAKNAEIEKHAVLPRNLKVLLDQIE